MKSVITLKFPPFFNLYTLQPILQKRGFLKSYLGNPLCLWVLHKELKNTTWTSLKVIDFFAILSLEYMSSRVNTTLI